MNFLFVGPSAFENAIELQLQCAAIHQQIWKEEQKRLDKIKNEMKSYENEQEDGKSMIYEFNIII
jgi:hypothetical protein